MKELKIQSDFIKLDQFLKYANIVSSGGEAKILIMGGDVKVNDIVEYQRGKKLRSGDIIEINSLKFKII